MMTFTRAFIFSFWAPLALVSIGGVAFPACSGSATSGASGDAPIPVAYQAFAAAFDQERQQLGIPGASVALIQDGNVTFAHDFGTKGPSSKEPVGSGTLFRVRVDPHPDRRGEAGIEQRGNGPLVSSRATAKEGQNAE